MTVRIESPDDLDDLHPPFDGAHEGSSVNPQEISFLKRGYVQPLEYVSAPVITGIGSLKVDSGYFDSCKCCDQVHYTL